MSLATPRRTFGALLCAVPLGAALIAAPSASAAPADTGPYTNVELQARSNLLVNDEGYNLPPGSSYNSITPTINNEAQVAFRVQSVAYPDPGSSLPGVWLGGNGHGEVVHTGDAGWSISSDPGINAHGDILFTLSPSIVSSNLYLYDAASGTAEQVDTAPVRPNSYSAPGIDDAGNMGFQALFSGGRAFAGVQDGAGVFYVSDSNLETDSPYTYLYTPSYNNAGQIAGKVATSDDMTTEQEIRLFEADGSSQLLLANQAVDPASPYDSFDNSLGLNDEGVIAVVARRAADGQRVLVRSDGTTTTTTEIAAVDPDGTIHGLEFFRPDINNHGQVVFRAVDADGQAIYVGDGTTLTRVVGKGYVVEIDLGTGQLGQHDDSPVFGGAPSINDHGDVVFTAGVHPEGDNQVEWGSGVFVAYGDPQADEPGAVSEDIIATVPEDDPGVGSLSISVDPDDRTVLLPEMVASGDRYATSGALRPVWVTDTRTADPGWDVTAQVSDFTGEAATFGGGFLGWSPTVESASDGQVVTPGEPVAPGFPTGDGLSEPQALASAAVGEGLGTAELGAGLDLQVPLDTPAGTYTAVLTVTVI